MDRKSGELYARLLFINEYLSVGNVRMGMRVKEIATTTASLRYFHTDHLGSISV